MTSRHLAFYRSAAVRVSFVVSGAFLTVTLSPWGPREWRDTPSLRWLHQLLPWPLLSAGFLLYTLLLLWGTPLTTTIGDWLGLFMYLCGLAALIATLSPHRPANPFAIAALFLACVMHYAAARLVTFQTARERSR